MMTEPVPHLGLPHVSPTDWHDQGHLLTAGVSLWWESIWQAQRQSYTTMKSPLIGTVAMQIAAFLHLSPSLGPSVSLLGCSLLQIPQGTSPLQQEAGHAELTVPLAMQQ